MENLEAIFTRRSIRKFTSAVIEEPTIKTLLEAAMAAPSAGNQQPWHFILVDDRSLLNQISQVHPYAQMLREAPLSIVVCGDTRAEKHIGFWVQDCSAATQNLLLAAHGCGLGAVWLGVYPREDRVNPLRQLFQLPDPIIPFSIVALGHPAEQKPAAKRFDEKRVSRNAY